MLCLTSLPSTRDRLKELGRQALRLKCYSRDMNTEIKLIYLKNLYWTLPNQIEPPFTVCVSPINELSSK